MPDSPDTNVTRPPPHGRVRHMVEQRGQLPLPTETRHRVPGSGRRSRPFPRLQRRILDEDRRLQPPHLRPGSTPSSSASKTRSRRPASNASPWRPSRYNAVMSWAHRRSRSGFSATSFLALRNGVAATPAAKIAAIRSSTIDARSSSSPAASVRANGRSANSASAGPRQSASASSKRAIAAACSPRSASRRPSATRARAVAASVVSLSSA